MFNADEQSLLLTTIEHLQLHYEFLPKPCIALLISKHYRVLSNLPITKDQKQNYGDKEAFWLACYINNQRHSKKMQSHLHDFIQFHEFIFNTI